MLNYKIHANVHGPYKNFSHIVEDTETKKAIIFDPAWDAHHLAEQIKALDVELEAIWITHGHHDHVSAINELRKIYPVPVYASKIEIDFIHSYAPSVPEAFLPLPQDTLPLNDGDLLMVGHTSVKALHTPGHTSGSLCFLLDNDLITGDTLFVDGSGRTDLMGSNTEALYHSLKRIVDIVPHKVSIRTGHAYGQTLTDTLANQIMRNPYLIRLADKAEFIRYRNSH